MIKKIKDLSSTHQPYGPVVLGICPIKIITCPHKHIHMIVLNSIIYDSHQTGNNPNVHKPVQRQIHWSIYREWILSSEINQTLIRATGWTNLYKHCSEQKKLQNASSLQFHSYNILKFICLGAESIMMTKNQDLRRDCLQRN